MSVSHVNVGIADCAGADVGLCLSGLGAGLNDPNSDNSGVLDIEMTNDSREGIIMTDSNDHVVASCGLETIVKTATAEQYIYMIKRNNVEGSGDMKVDGRISVNGDDSKIVGPVYIQGGRNLNPSIIYIVEKFGYSVYKHRRRKK